LPGKKITVLTIVDRISSFYSLYPFLLFGGGKRFVFTSSAEFCLKEDANDTLIMVREFIKPDHVDIPLLERLRAKYKTIAFFHDDAGGGIPRLEVLPYVNLFYTKALFKDRSLYTRSLYGKELYSDYYHRTYGVTDDNPRERAAVTDLSQLDKLRLSWNIGIGDFPREKLRQRAGTLAAKLFGSPAAAFFYSRKKPPADPVKNNRGTIAVHARMGLADRPSIAFHRKLILEKIGSDRRFLLGETGQRRYNRELGNSKIVLSPFGWGELCIRDFEALRSGALLLKPDMDHLETWPDIFFKNKTYVPFSWDAGDLIALVNAFLADEAQRKQTAQNALDAYHDQLKELPRRFDRIITEIEQ
jgi:hypothetical protein